MKLTRSLLVAILVTFFGAPAALALDVGTAILRIERTLPLPISRLDLPPADLGFAGGRLGIEDNQTTGRFIGVDFTMETRSVPPEEAAAALDELRANQNRLIIVMADDETLAALADHAGEDVLLFNATARDEALRNDECRANVLHVVPSRAMLADAVMQFLVWKKWARMFLIFGSHPEDHLLADAYRSSAEKFGINVVEEREFVDTGGARRTDSGHVQVQRQIPVFTQRAKEHDIVLAADEADVFAAYLPYHVWDARPVAGSAGLRAVTWHSAHEAWGATQFQRRFERLAGRPMREEDYQVWLATRVIGEAVTRTGKSDPSAIRAYALSEKFELAAFKGQKLTFRDWNGQLRQPILLTNRHTTVSVSPQDGFLHQNSPLDTLGADRPESTCRAFEGATR
ncbi:ABC transporter substrate-binding protein [Notoacmeibacter sp. MSK16QG-6]|uniref:ABC transporter substrate-binding protein n=1 Tax=Notoacmeibacter sp. MSK16QG-6 TaxID=2957982 RepID=UPI00209CF7FB|nr:ABC transporter substrate-binding protein [Notoacmeibacter sp. MSK16QG-6]MCP1200655.1 ABC transporter substrate-binding protein [Notoacmeibacter sp. MSK16QG-6]